MESQPFALRNKYWVLRHGRSVPNERGLIVSSLTHGKLPEYGLAPEGVQQAKAAGESFLMELKTNNIALENVRICYSPFARTRETAEVVASVLNIPFGSQLCKYSEIWALDEVDPFMAPEGGESVADVSARLAKALATMEAEFHGFAVLVVSHGDPLQILQTILQASTQNEYASDLVSRIRGVIVPNILSQHRKHALLTGELRRVA
ncbi:uncharacterized protein LOC116260454 isoform X2 [Nymphaea colorata]|uniref:uncharacterized protein LOC116260454 isoform X2 n=1 Tax=Nymphaea colorata TaxID=210225 RepID=UPI00214F3A53|nr:uncharacterized protein LOC116260454 isoform X2 [Nymphaea colorata]